MMNENHKPSVPCPNRFARPRHVPSLVSKQARHPLGKKRTVKPTRKGRGGNRRLQLTRPATISNVAC